MTHRWTASPSVPLAVLALAFSLIAPVEAKADAVLLSCKGTGTTFWNGQRDGPPDKATLSIAVDIGNNSLTVDQNTYPIQSVSGNVIIAGDASSHVELDRVSGEVTVDWTPHGVKVSSFFYGHCEPARKLF